MPTVFKWDDSALKPAEVTVDFSALSGIPEDRVTFYELPRTELVNFVSESLEKKVVEEVKDSSGQPVKNEDGSTKVKTRPFKEVESEHSEYLFNYLAISTRDKKAPEFFAGLPLTGTAINGLVDMLLKINHVEEVLASSGNWLMLPTIRNLFAAEAKESDNPVEISPAP